MAAATPAAIVGTSSRSSSTNASSDLTFAQKLASAGSTITTSTTTTTTLIDIDLVRDCYRHLLS